MSLSNLDKANEEYRRSMALLEEQATSKFIEVYEPGLEAIAAEREMYEKKIQESIDQYGQVLSPSWAFQIERLNEIEQDIRQTLNQYETEAKKVAADASYAAAKLGARTPYRIAESVNPGITAGWGMVNQGLYTEVVGQLTSGPVYERVGRFGDAFRDKALTSISTGVMLGKNPRDIARDLVGTSSGPMASYARTLARNVIQESAHMASHEVMKANADIVDGWYWLAAKQPGRTCLSCMGMDGRWFPLDMRLPRHVNCRCVMIVDLNDGSTDELIDGMTLGQEFFDSLPAKEQDKWGKRAAGALRSGDARLIDYVSTRYSNPDFGLTFSENSTKRAIETRAVRSNDYLTDLFPFKQPAAERLQAVPKVAEDLVKYAREWGGSTIARTGDIPSTGYVVGGEYPGVDKVADNAQAQVTAMKFLAENSQFSTYGSWLNTATGEMAFDIVEVVTGFEDAKRKAWEFGQDAFYSLEHGDSFYIAYKWSNEGEINGVWESEAGSDWIAANAGRAFDGDKDPDRVLTGKPPFPSGPAPVSLDSLTADDSYDAAGEAEPTNTPEPTPKPETYPDRTKPDLPDVDPLLRLPPFLYDTNAYKNALNPETTAIPFDWKRGMFKTLMSGEMPKIMTDFDTWATVNQDLREQNNPEMGRIIAAETIPDMHVYDQTGVEPDLDHWHEASSERYRTGDPLALPYQPGPQASLQHRYGAIQQVNPGPFGYSQYSGINPQTRMVPLFVPKGVSADSFYKQLDYSKLDIPDGASYARPGSDVSVEQGQARQYDNVPGGYVLWVDPRIAPAAHWLLQSGASLDSDYIGILLRKGTGSQPGSSLPRWAERAPSPSATINILRSGQLEALIGKKAREDLLRLALDAYDLFEIDAMNTTVGLHETERIITGAINNEIAYMSGISPEIIADNRMPLPVPDSFDQFVQPLDDPDDPTAGVKRYFERTMPWLDVTLNPPLASGKPLSKEAVERLARQYIRLYNGNPVVARNIKSFGTDASYVDSVLGPLDAKAIFIKRWELAAFMSDDGRALAINPNYLTQTSIENADRDEAANPKMFSMTPESLVSHEFGHAVLNTLENRFKDHKLGMIGGSTGGYGSKDALTVSALFAATGTNADTVSDFWSTAGEISEYAKVNGGEAFAESYRVMMTKPRSDWPESAYHAQAIASLTTMPKVSSATSGLVSTKWVDVYNSDKREALTGSTGDLFANDASDAEVLARVIKYAKYGDIMAPPDSGLTGGHTPKHWTGITGKFTVDFFEQTNAAFTPSALDPRAMYDTKLSKHEQNVMLAVLDGDNAFTQYPSWVNVLPVMRAEIESGEIGNLTLAIDDGPIAALSVLRSVGVPSTERFTESKMRLVLSSKPIELFTGSDIRITERYIESAARAAPPINPGTDVPKTVMSEVMSKVVTGDGVENTIIFPVVSDAARAFEKSLATEITSPADYSSTITMWSSAMGSYSYSKNVPRDALLAMEIADFAIKGGADPDTIIKATPDSNRPDGWTLAGIRDALRDGLGETSVHDAILADSAYRKKFIDAIIVPASRYAAENPDFDFRVRVARLMGDVGAIRGGNALLAATSYVPKDKDGRLVLVASPDPDLRYGDVASYYMNAKQSQVANAVLIDSLKKAGIEKVALYSSVPEAGVDHGLIGNVGAQVDGVDTTTVSIPSGNVSNVSQKWFINPEMAYKNSSYPGTERMIVIEVDVDRVVDWGGLTSVVGRDLTSGTSLGLAFNSEVAIAATPGERFEARDTTLERVIDSAYELKYGDDLRRIETSIQNVKDLGNGMTYGTVEKALQPSTVRGVETDSLGNTIERVSQLDEVTDWRSFIQRSLTGLDRKLPYSNRTLLSEFADRSAEFTLLERHMNSAMKPLQQVRAMKPLVDLVRGFDIVGDRFFTDHSSEDASPIGDLYTAMYENVGLFTRERSAIEGVLVKHLPEVAKNDYLMVEYLAPEFHRLVVNAFKQLDSGIQSREWDDLVGFERTRFENSLWQEWGYLVKGVIENAHIDMKASSGYEKLSGYTTEAIQFVSTQNPGDYVVPVSGADQRVIIAKSSDVTALFRKNPDYSQSAISEVGDLFKKGYATQQELDTLSNATIQGLFNATIPSMQTSSGVTRGWWDAQKGSFERGLNATGWQTVTAVVHTDLQMSNADRVALAIERANNSDDVYTRAIEIADAKSIDITKSAIEKAGMYASRDVINIFNSDPELSALRTMAAAQKNPIQEFKYPKIDGTFGVVEGIYSTAVDGLILGYEKRSLAGEMMAALARTEVEVPGGYDSPDFWTTYERNLDLYIADNSNLNTKAGPVRSRIEQAAKDAMTHNQTQRHVQEFEAALWSDLVGFVGANDPTFSPIPGLYFDGYKFSPTSSYGALLIKNGQPYTNNSIDGNDRPMSEADVVKSTLGTVEAFNSGRRAFTSPIQKGLVEYARSNPDADLKQALTDYVRTTDALLRAGAIAGRGSARSFLNDAHNKAREMSVAVSAMRQIDYNIADRLADYRVALQDYDLVNEVIKYMGSAPSDMPELSMSNVLDGTIFDYFDKRIAKSFDPSGELPGGVTNLQELANLVWSQTPEILSLAVEPIPDDLVDEFWDTLSDPDVQFKDAPAWAKDSFMRSESISASMQDLLNAKTGADASIMDGAIRREEMAPLVPQIMQKIGDVYGASRALGAMTDYDVAYEFSQIADQSSFGKGGVIERFLTGRQALIEVNNALDKAGSPTNALRKALENGYNQAEFIRVFENLSENPYNATSNDLWFRTDAYAATLGESATTVMFDDMITTIATNVYTHQERRVIDAFLNKQFSPGAISTAVEATDYLTNKTRDLDTTNADTLSSPDLLIRIDTATLKVAIDATGVDKTVWDGVKSISDSVAIDPDGAKRLVEHLVGEAATRLNTEKNQAIEAITTRVIDSWSQKLSDVGSAIDSSNPIYRDGLKDVYATAERLVTSKTREEFREMAKTAEGVRAINAVNALGDFTLQVDQLLQRASPVAMAAVQLDEAAFQRIVTDVAVMVIDPNDTRTVTELVTEVRNQFESRTGQKLAPDRTEYPGYATIKQNNVFREADSQRAITVTETFMERNLGAVDSKGIPLGGPPDFYHGASSPPEVKDHVVNAVATRMIADGSGLDALRLWETVSGNKWNDGRKGGAQHINDRMYAVVDTVLSGWASTSAKDHNAEMLQFAAVKEFDLPHESALRRYSQSRVDTLLSDTAPNTNRGEWAHVQLYRQVLRTMYAQTQEYIDQAEAATELDLSTIPLYRGQGIATDDSYEFDLWQQNSADSEGAGTPTSFTLQPLSSFSTSYSVADGFSSTSNRPMSYTDSAIFTAEIPRERILALARTGMGCLGELEWIVIGGDVKIPFSLGSLGHESDYSYSLSGYGNASAGEYGWGDPAADAQRLHDDYISDVDAINQRFSSQISQKEIDTYYRLAQSRLDKGVAPGDYLYGKQATMFGWIPSRTKESPQKFQKPYDWPARMWESATGFDNLIQDFAPSGARDLRDYLFVDQRDALARDGVDLSTPVSDLSTLPQNQRDAFREYFNQNIRLMQNVGNLYEYITPGTYVGLQGKVDGGDRSSRQNLGDMLLNLTTQDERRAINGEGPVIEALTPVNENVAIDNLANNEVWGVAQFGVKYLKVSLDSSAAAELINQKADTPEEAYVRRIEAKMALAREALDRGWASDVTAFAVDPNTVQAFSTPISNQTVVEKVMADYPPAIEVISPTRRIIDPVTAQTFLDPGVYQAAAARGQNTVLDVLEYEYRQKAIAMNEALVKSLPGSLFPTIDTSDRSLTQTVQRITPQEVLREMKAQSDLSRANLQIITDGQQFEQSLSEIAKLSEGRPSEPLVKLAQQELAKLFDNVGHPEGSQVFIERAVQSYNDGGEGYGRDLSAASIIVGGTKRLLNRLVGNTLSDLDVDSRPEEDEWITLYIYLMGTPIMNQYALWEFFDSPPPAGWTDGQWFIALFAAARSQADPSEPVWKTLSNMLSKAKEGPLFKGTVT